MPSELLGKHMREVNSGEEYALGRSVDCAAVVHSDEVDGAFVLGFSDLHVIGPYAALDVLGYVNMEVCVGHCRGSCRMA